MTRRGTRGGVVTWGAVVFAGALGARCSERSAVAVRQGASAARPIPYVGVAVRTKVSRCPGALTDIGCRVHRHFRTGITSPTCGLSRSGRGNRAGPPRKIIFIIERARRDGPSRAAISYRHRTVGVQSASPWHLLGEPFRPLLAGSEPQLTFVGQAGVASFFGREKRRQPPGPPTSGGWERGSGNRLRRRRSRGVDKTSLRWAARATIGRGSSAVEGQLPPPRIVDARLRASRSGQRQVAGAARGGCDSPVPRAGIRAGRVAYGLPGSCFRPPGAGSRIGSAPLNADAVACGAVSCSA